MNELITPILTALLGGIVGSGLTYLYFQKKYTIEDESEYCTCNEEEEIVGEIIISEEEWQELVERSRKEKE